MSMVIKQSKWKKSPGTMMPESALPLSPITRKQDSCRLPTPGLPELKLGAQGRCLHAQRSKLGAHELRTLHHTLQLPERHLARQVLHAAIGRNDDVFRV